jgi:transposase-like protein
MNSSHRRDADQWRQIVSAQPGSGLSIAAYCRDRGISQPSFFVWRRRLRGVAAPFVELTASPAAGVEGNAPAVEVLLRGGRRLLLRSGFDRDLLIQIVQALEVIA